MKIEDFLQILDSYAPLELSHKLIEKGDYDNSGLLVKAKETVSNAMFSLDLTKEVVDKAIENNCDMIVTHHPVIYYPIKSLSITDETAPLIYAIKNGMSIISMHLNLDVADRGIDYSLATGLGGKDIKILDYVDESHGYGREFYVDKDLTEFANDIKTTFMTDRVIFYGDKRVKKVASFCGGGSSHALKMMENKLTDADTVVTSDMPHHILKELVEMGKNVVIITHYASEQYGFYRFYQYIKEQFIGNANLYYFRNNRFM